MADDTEFTIIRFCAIGKHLYRLLIRKRYESIFKISED